MKAPLEHLESSTPMSAGEGTLYALIGGALIGLGFAVGWTKASLKSARDLQVERRSPNTRSRERDNRRNTQP
jgi:hypothetical protein